MESNKFKNFKPVIDTYIKKHFAAALVYKGLLSSVQHCAEWMVNSERPEQIQKCFATLEYIFKFIIQSRQLFAHATGGQYEDSFKRDLYAVFTSLNAMLKAEPNETILSSQTALLNSIGVVFMQLSSVLTTHELSTLLKEMLDSVPLNGESRLIQAKLKAIKDLVTSEIFDDEELRSIILVISCKHLHDHIERREELKLCADIIEEILIKLHNTKDKHKHLETLCNSVLQILTQTIPIIMEGTVIVISSLISVFLGLLEELDESHFAKIWADFESDRLKKFVGQVLQIFGELIKQNW